MSISDHSPRIPRSPMARRRFLASAAAVGIGAGAVIIGASPAQAAVPEPNIFDTTAWNARHGCAWGAKPSTRSASACA